MTHPALKVSGNSKSISRGNSRDIESIEMEATIDVQALNRRDDGEPVKVWR